MIDLELDDAPADALLIDELGAPAIADELDITPSAVRNWRSRGIPENRRDELLSLLARRRDIGARGSTPDVPRLTPGVPAATHDVPNRHDAPFAASPLQPLDAIARRGERRYADALIAARQVRLAKRHAERAEVDSEGLPPILPVRGYAVRLILLFALDFPVLIMAFVAVTQACRACP